MQTDVRIMSARLMAPAAAIDTLHRFYGECLGFPVRSRRDQPGLEAGAGSVEFVAGAGSIAFVPAADAARPFYHVALLVPGNRFEAARAWVEPYADLLSRPGQTTTMFRFGAWEADACYFHDPAQNIVELIAHRGVAESRSPSCGFQAAELAGISELSLVVDDPRAAAGTLTSAGLDLWSGGVEGPDALAFIGGQAHTLILCPPGRPWLPTQRPAECHPVSANLDVASGKTVTVRVAGGTLTVDS